MFTLSTDKPGATELLLGNEAIARGALEAGISVAAAYPGTPSSEILESLAKVAKDAGIYVEWSTNEKVAAEVAAAASYAGLRSLAAMKQEGLNVALDYLGHLNLAGTVGGMVVVAADDPAGWSSPGENDSRRLVRWLSVPLLEPATAQEAKDMTKWAIEQSEALGLFFVVRSVTRLSHATGPVVLGELPTLSRVAHMDTSKTYVPSPGQQRHSALLEKFARAKPLIEDAPFNGYEGPKTPRLIVAAAGVSRLYAREAIKLLGLADTVGILHIGTTAPLPARLIATQLAKVDTVLVVEEVDPFLEDSLTLVANEIGWLGPGRRILGKSTGHIAAHGEMRPDVVANALAQILDIARHETDSPYGPRAQELLGHLMVARETIWCAGCPHRASLWNMKNAFRLDGKDAVLAGDIGCYALDRTGLSGFQITRTASAMGSSAGVASGLGKLGQFGMTQPILGVCGDSTFFHAAIPALVNAVYNRSNFTMVVLDNSATAMTGFQPHAGVGRNATGEAAPKVDIELLCRSLGVDVLVRDPFELQETTETLLDLMGREDGVRVLVLRRECALLRPRDAKAPFKVSVQEERCLADGCGCDRYCTRVFKCPGLMVDRATGKAKIDEAVCAGCGVCAAVCPASAISKEPINA